MCYTNYKTPKTSEKEIKCWKTVEVRFGILFVTPFVSRWIPRKVLMGGKPFRARGRERSYYGYKFNAKYVERGYIHAWTSEQIALQELKNSNAWNPGKYVLMECSIKPGTPYYVSTTGTVICAKELWFINKNDSKKEHREKKNENS